MDAWPEGMQGPPERWLADGPSHAGSLRRASHLRAPHAPHVQVYNFNVPTFGRGVVYDVDQRIRSEQFRFVADALRTTKLRTYVPAFKQVAGRRRGRGPPALSPRCVLPDALSAMLHALLCGPPCAASRELAAQARLVRYLCLLAWLPISASPAEASCRPERPRAAAPAPSPARTQEAEAYFAKWGDEGVVDLMQAFSDLIILTASRTLLGEPPAPPSGQPPPRRQRHAVRQLS